MEESQKAQGGILFSGLRGIHRLGVLGAGWQSMAGLKVQHQHPIG